jgi:hypothetical protein
MRALSPPVGAAAPTGIAPAAPAIAPTDLAESGDVSNRTIPRIIIAVGALAVVLVALAVIVSTIKDPSFVQSAHAPSTPVQGLTIFATFFVAASAIERLLEPLAGFLPSSQDAKADAQTKMVAAGQAVASGSPDSTAHLQNAAAAADDANFMEYWKSVSLWTLATVVAMAAAALLRLYFLHTVGISNGTRTIEILATGLIIGSGTKPLHDLVTLISQTSKGS